MRQILSAFPIKGFQSMSRIRSLLFVFRCILLVALPLYPSSGGVFTSQMFARCKILSSQFIRICRKTNSLFSLFDEKLFLRKMFRHLSVSFSLPFITVFFYRWPNHCDVYAQKQTVTVLHIACAYLLTLLIRISRLPVSVEANIYLRRFLASNCGHLRILTSIWRAGLVTRARQLALFHFKMRRCDQGLWQYPLLLASELLLEL